MSLVRGLAVAGVMLTASAALAAPKVAVFPFDLRDAEQAGEIVPVIKETDIARMRLAADELKSLMTKSGRYEVIDLAPHEAEVQAASPFDKCNGCEADLAKKFGAEFAVTGFVDKLSDALISLQLFMRDAKTGEMVKTMSAEIRGNTDELWLHGIRYLWKNRFNNEAPKP